ncbi:MAG: hypothetical protein NC548_38535 [Lachnospiraceae bacterium]|nr:hypothetical protein [Lachnospiraceae bacterium]
MKFNGSFNYKQAGDAQVDPTTGFYDNGDDTAFVKGCECQIDVSIPAKTMIGTDGQTYAYTYDVFIPKYFRGELAKGDTIQLVGADGREIDTITIMGVDTLNRKYIEVWG